MFRSALVSPKMLMLVTKRKTLIGVCFAGLSLLVDGTMSFHGPLWGKSCEHTHPHFPNYILRVAAVDSHPPGRIMAGSDQDHVRPVVAHPHYTRDRLVIVNVQRVQD